MKSFFSTPHSNLCCSVGNMCFVEHFDFFLKIEFVVGSKGSNFSKKGEQKRMRNHPHCVCSFWWLVCWCVGVGVC